MNFGIVRLYMGETGKKKYYNLQELGLAHALEKRGVRVYIFFLKSRIQEIQTEKESEQITIVYLPAWQIQKHGLFSCKELLNFSLDMIQIQSDNQLFAPSVMRFCTKNHIPFYNYVGVIDSTSKNGMVRLAMQILAWRNLRYFAKSKVYGKNPFICERMKKRGNVVCSCLPVGLDLTQVSEITDSQEQLRQKYNIPSEAKVFLCVGRLEADRNPELILDFISRMPESDFLIIIGKGSYEKMLKEKVRSGRNVRLIPELPNCQVQEYMKLSDFYLNFSKTEIFGMSLLEAMYWKCICVAIHAPGPDFILENKISGYLVSCIDEMINVVLSETEVSIGEAARERVLTEFTWDRFVDRLWCQENMNG